ncbi:hypothetical protein D3C72_1224970 [compost metagenome]
MERLLAETELEKKLLCYGAVYLEEGHILDHLFEAIGGEIGEGEELDPEVRDDVLDEVSECFFRIDMNFPEEVRGDCVALLQEMWSVHDKKSALTALEKIRTEGHRTKFNVLKDCIPSEGRIDILSLEKFKQVFIFDMVNSEEVKMLDEEFKKLAEWMQRTQKYLGASGILAWDLARSVHLARLSYVAGYLDDNEAWAEILKLAPLSVDKFGNWLEFSQSFLIGLTFWAGQEIPEVKSSCERLLGNPASPWNFYAP